QINILERRRAPDPPIRLHDLENVEATNVADGDGLSYNHAIGKWEAGPAAGGISADNIQLDLIGDYHTAGNIFVTLRWSVFQSVGSSITLATDTTTLNFTPGLYIGSSWLNY